MTGKGKKINYPHLLQFRFSEELYKQMREDLKKKVVSKIIRALLRGYYKNVIGLDSEGNLITRKQPA